MHAIGPAPALPVSVQRFGIKIFDFRAAPARQAGFVIEIGVHSDHRFGERRALRQKKPVIICLCDRRLKFAQQQMGWNDVHQREAEQRIGKIQRQPVRRPGTPVMADQMKPVKPQMGHQGMLVRGHFAKRISGDAQRFRTVAIPAQIGGDDGVILRQNRRNGVPHRAHLRKAVQQQNGRAVTAGRIRNRLIVYRRLMVGKSGNSLRHWM